MTLNLDAFVSHSKPPPGPVATSAEIRDRGSIFVAVIYRCTSPASAEKLRKHHGLVVHAKNPATHEMAAWRCMCVKKGKTGLGGEDDFEVTGGKKNDGENGGGKVILDVMESEGIMDAVVVVTRWYGGNLLGPVRFTHIETVTREVCKRFKLIDEIEEIISSLEKMDAQLAELRAELASAPTSSPASSQTLATSQPSSQTPDSEEAGAESELSQRAKRRKVESDNVEHPDTDVSPQNTEGSKQQPILLVDDDSTDDRQRKVPAKSEKEPTKPNYRAMLLEPIPDLNKAKRLLNARESAIRSVKTLLDKRKQQSTADNSNF